MRPDTVRCVDQQDQPSASYTAVDVATFLVTVVAFFVGIIILIVGLGHEPSQKDAVDDTRAVLITIGVTVATGALFLGLQQWYYVRRRLEQKRQEVVRLHADLEKAPSRITTGIEVYAQFSDLEVQEIIHQARRELRMFVVSGRHVLSPNTRAIVIKKLQDPTDHCQIRVLAMDGFGPFVVPRSEMIDMPAHHDYRGDLTTARVYAREITDLDPEHSKFDMRFYTKLPTTFFFVADDSLYVTFLLSKPVAECPVFVINRRAHPEIAARFDDHFRFYWDKSRYYVTVIAFDPQSDQFVMIENKKRQGLEWPSGYMEPDEEPRFSARREFVEETGLDLARLDELARTPFGIYYVGVVGERIQRQSEREVSQVRLFDRLPARHDLSFEDDHTLFQELLVRARRVREDRWPISNRPNGATQLRSAESPSS